MSPHPTKHMMSTILLLHVKLMYLPQTSAETIANESDDEEHEPMSLKITINHEGNLMMTNQFYNYYYQAHTLQSMSFFDFAQSVKLEKKVNKIQDTTEL